MKELKQNSTVLVRKIRRVKNPPNSSGLDCESRARVQGQAPPSRVLQQFQSKVLAGVGLKQTYSWYQPARGWIAWLAQSFAGDIGITNPKNSQQLGSQSQPTSCLPSKTICFEERRDQLGFRSRLGWPRRFWRGSGQIVCSSFRSRERPSLPRVTSVAEVAY